MIGVKKSATDELHGKIITLEESLNENILERPTEIRTGICALIARKHHFQVGPPGCAKTYMVRQLFSHIEGLTSENLFQLMLTAYTTPEEMFGIPSIKAMENDEYRRNIDYKLPKAFIAMLDEIFTAPPSCLNTMLTIMNERLFFNGKGPERANLQTLFAASNAIPRQDELHALWDRLHFRHQVKPLQSKSNFVKMLQLSISKKVQEPKPVIHWEEIAALQEKATDVDLPPDVLSTLTQLRDDLAKQSIEVTDRRFNESVAIIQATAVINGRYDKAEIDDLRLLQHVLWSREEDIKAIATSVLHLANPTDQKAEDIIDSLNKMSRDLTEAQENKDATSGRAIAKVATETHSKVKRATQECKELEAEAQASGRESEGVGKLKAKIDELKLQLYNIFKATGVSE